MRLRTVLPGVVVGEIALYTGVPRTADVVAETPSVVLRLTRASIERMERSEPELAAARTDGSRRRCPSGSPTRCVRSTRCSTDGCGACSSATRATRTRTRRRPGARAWCPAWPAGPRCPGLPTPPPPRRRTRSRRGRQAHALRVLLEELEVVAAEHEAGDEAPSGERRAAAHTPQRNQTRPGVTSGSRDRSFVPSGLQKKAGEYSFATLSVVPVFRSITESGVATVPPCSTWNATRLPSGLTTNEIVPLNRASTSRRPVPRSYATSRCRTRRPTRRSRSARPRSKPAR